MQRDIKSTSFAFVLVLSVFALRADAASLTCQSSTETQLLEKLLATASSWSNFRGAAGSISVESHRMLKAAEQGMESAKPPAKNYCPEHCKPTLRPVVEFRTTPNKFLADYGDKQKCEQLFERTRQNPFEYEQRKFPSVDAFSDWFAEFSKGSGKDGADLYARCDGDCSPRYLSVIRADHGSYSVNVSVVCGPARDKSDDQYELVSAYRWGCEAQ